MQNFTIRLRGLRLWQILGLFSVITIPFAEAFLKVPLNAKRSLNITFFDALIFLSFLSLVISCIRDKSLVQGVVLNIKKLIPEVIMILAAGVSVFSIDFSQNQAAVLFGKSIVQYMEYFLIAPLIFITLSQEYDKLFFAFIIAAITVAVASCVTDYFFLDNHSLFSVGGILLNKNNFAAFFALSFPFALKYILACSDQSVFKYVIAVFAFAGIFMLLTAWSLMAILFILVFFSFVAMKSSGEKSNVLIVIVFIAVFFGTVSFRAGDLNRSVQVFVNYTDPESGESSVCHTMRYYRWAANLNLVKNNLFTGVGLGQYGKRIKAYYGGINIPEGRTDIEASYDVKTSEPFSFGLLFVLLGELGLIGGIAFLLVLSGILYSALENNRDKIGGRFDTALLVSAVFSIVIIALFANPLARGCGGVISCLIALPLCNRAAVKKS